MSKNNSPKILLDSDVFRHFLNGGQISLLPVIYPGRLVMLDRIKNELCRSKSLITPVKDFLAINGVCEVSFPTNREIIIEYAYLTRQYGIGESACMAVARYQSQFIASSNLKDIKSYCVQHGITYLTTMDILKEAFDQKLLSKHECDHFISNVKSKGSKLPFETMDKYLDSLK
jgi:predicted nucleic acid-binding protein